MVEYGYYSNTQFKIMKRDKSKPYIYWKNKNGNIVQVTEVTSSPDQYHYNFKDVIELGELQSFYSASSTNDYLWK